MPPAYVKAYVKRNKNDAADAEAICEAVTRPSMLFVPVKDADQQSVLMMHRARNLLVRQRTMLVNALRAHLAEFGVIAAQGLRHVEQLIAAIEAESTALPELARSILRLIVSQLSDTQAKIQQVEAKLAQWHRNSRLSKLLATIPGVGIMGASAIAATVCDPKPGSRGTDWRVHGVYDLGAGGFSHLELTDKHGGEALDRGAGVEGEIRIADRGYSAAKALRRFVASVKQAKGADCVVRLRWRSFRLREPCGAKFDLIAHLQNMPKEQNIDDLRVLIERAGDPNSNPLSTRIVIARKPEEAARAERERQMREARKKGKQLDPRSLIAAEYVMLATSLPENAYPASEILALYRLRWQIDIYQAWRLSRLSCGSVRAVGGPRRHAAPGWRRCADRLQRRDGLGIGAHQHGALRAAADVAAG